MKNNVKQTKAKSKAKSKVDKYYGDLLMELIKIEQKKEQYNMNEILINIVIALKKWLDLINDLELVFLSNEQKSAIILKIQSLTKGITVGLNEDEENYSYVKNWVDKLTKSLSETNIIRIINKQRNKPDFKMAYPIQDY